MTVSHYLGPRTPGRQAGQDFTYGLRYENRLLGQEALIKRIVDLVKELVQYGYKRIYVLLKREEIHINYKRVTACIASTTYEQQPTDGRVKDANVSA